MNDFTPTFMPKTDLASEIHEYLSKKSPPDIDGIVHERKKVDILDVQTVMVQNMAGAKKTGKPIGRYTTVNVGKLTGVAHEEFKSKCVALSKILSEYIPESGSCLFAGIGNRRITADASGPECADRIVVTRHLKNSAGGLFKQMGLRETMCITTDVLGNTGLEAAEILSGIVEDAKPSFIIVADALATSSLSRLATTVQICDTGLSPGSGVNNRRLSITSETMGVPVFAIGIPTVADIVSVVTEAYLGSGIDASGESDKNIAKLHEAFGGAISASPSARFITPKDSDAIIRASAKLMAYAINLTLHRDLSYEDMCELISN